MEPMIIMAGASLAAGLMNQAQQRKDKKAAAEQHAFDNQIQAVQTGVNGEQNAFAKMMDAYKSALT